MTVCGRLKLLLLLTASLFAMAAMPAFALEGEQRVFPAVAAEHARLVIRGATDVEAMIPLILDFQQLASDVTVELNDYVTNDLFKEAEDACAKKIPYGDLLLSSSVDQLVKLANDGCAQEYRSPETERVADWANWRDEVFSFTFEPAVIVYDG